MTATNVVCQRQHKLIHLVTDAASYDSNGIVVGLGTKVFPIAHWPGVVTGRGTAIAIPVLGQELSWRFADFDECVDEIEAQLPSMVGKYRITGSVELILAGWSKRNEEPRSYVIETSDDLPLGMTDVERSAARAAGTAFIPDAYDLQRLPNFVSGPMLTKEATFASWWEGIDPNSAPFEVVRRLRKLIEIQRSMTAEDKHWVGGFIEHTVVTSDSVSQRILHRWPEDRMGELIQPNPIDWDVWNAANGFTTVQSLEVVG